MLKRNMDDQLLNTCSLVLSERTGYNNNGQVSDIFTFFITYYMDQNQPRKMTPEFIFLYVMQYQPVYKSGEVGGRRG